MATRGVCRVVCGLLFLLLGVFGVALYVMFTPVYKPVSCQLSGGMPDGVSIPGLPIPGLPFLNPTSGPAKVSVKIDVSCDNPNAVSVDMQSALGTVYVGKDRVEVGDVEIFPESYMPAWSSGSIYSRASVDLNPALLEKVLPNMLLSGIPIQIEFKAHGAISMPFLLGLSVSPVIHQTCGMELASLTNIVTHPDRILGPMACANDFDSLKIPPAEAEDTKLFEKLIARAERVKDIVCCTMVVVGFALGFYLVGCFGFTFRRCARGRQAKDTEVEIAQKKDAATIGKAAEEDKQVPVAEV